MSNSKQFLTAAETVKKLSQTPTDEELLDLYGFYKQATVGDVNIPKPNFINLKESKKWEKWNIHKGLSKFHAEVGYVVYVNRLIQKYGTKDSK